MQVRNTPLRWGAVSQLLHWLVVALVITQFVLASLAEDLAPGMAKLALLARHKSVGITILGLALLRLAWRLGQPVPALPSGMPRWQRGLATGTHHLLYALLLAMPLSGWLMSSARNYPVSWFGLVQLPDLITPGERAFEALRATHGTLAALLAATALLHLAGALKHHFVDRDDVLRRMLPFMRPRALVPLPIVVPGLLAVAAVLASAGAPAFAAPPGAKPAPKPAANAAVHYELDPARSTIEFRFRQAGAVATGTFRRVTASLDWPGSGAPAAARLEVGVEVGTLDTKDKDRDDTLRGADLFDVGRFPQARFVATRITPSAATAGGFLAQGTLQIRDRARTLALPLTLSLATESGRRVATLRGETTLRRLEYGVGQGEWQSTEWVDDEVVVRWDLRLEERK